MDFIEEQLLDADGSCRDITFSGLSAEGASALLDYFSASFELANASDEEGRSMVLNEVREHVGRAELGMLQSDWRSNGLIAHLQLFFSWETREAFFAEVTFFPRDVVREGFSLALFLRFLEPLVHAASVEQFYVRYENASWEFGDTGRTSGVIFSAKEFKEWANQGMKPTR